MEGHNLIGGRNDIITKTIIAKDSPEPIRDPFLQEFAGRINEKHQMTTVVCGSDGCLVFGPTRMQSLQQR